MRGYQGFEVLAQGVQVDRLTVSTVRQAIQNFAAKDVTGQLVDEDLQVVLDNLEGMFQVFSDHLQTY